MPVIETRANQRIPKVFSVSPSSLDAQETSLISRSPYLALATGSLAFVLGTVNVTVSNVAFPEIVRSFPGVSNGMTGWIIAGYSLAFASTMLAGGRLADRYGRLTVFRVGLFGLLIGALGAGLAPSPLILVFARAIQGMFGALTVPSSLALVLPQFPQTKQASVIGIWAAAGMVASGLSPGFAALVLEVSSWRWVYLILVPIVALGLIGAKLYLEETAEAKADSPLDLLGVLMGSASVFLLVLGTLQGRSWGWLSPYTVACFAGTTLLLPLFLIRSSKHPEPLFDPGLFRIRSFTVSNVAVTFAMVGAFTSWFLWPLFLTEVWEYSKAKVGLAFTPSPVLSAVVAVLGGRWADRRGFRGIMALAALIATVGFLWLYFFLDEEVQFWFAFFPSSVMFGFGMGVLASQLNSAALRDIPPESTATANGIHQSLRYAVGGMGAATAITVLNGTHEVQRYSVMWLLLGILMFLVAPLMWFLYPKEPNAVRNQRR
jgi:EmrB/QacA subfamily drug resistance transporter